MCISLLIYRYLVPKKSIPASEKSEARDTDLKSDDLQPPPAKRAKRRGQNKSRPRPAFIPFSEMLCPSCYHGDGMSESGGCKFGEKCRYSHDIVKYMSSKPPDISDDCYLFKTYGRCPYGRACRFASSHMTANFENVVNESLYDPNRSPRTLNVIPRSLQEKLRKRRLPFAKSEAYLSRLKETKKKEELHEQSGSLANRQEQDLRTSMDNKDSDVPLGKADEERPQPCATDKPISDESSATTRESDERRFGESVCVQTSGSLTDQDVVKLKPSEKKMV